MAKFLNYEDRLEIESGLKEHMTFTELGEKLGRDRTTITKEISIIPASTEKHVRGKKYVGQMTAGIHW